MSVTKVLEKISSLIEQVQYQGWAITFNRNGDAGGGDFPSVVRLCSMKEDNIIKDR